jgi:Uma2 family endonuclease
MAVRANPVTAEELLAMPDDGRRYELIRGELRVMPLRGVEHGRVAATIGGLLFTYAASARRSISTTPSLAFASPLASCSVS